MNQPLRFKFSIRYFLLAIVLFITEVLIALYVRDQFIRPYFGDFLVVMLVYCGVRTFVQGDVWKIALGSLLFAYFVETMQYFRIVDKLGLNDNIIAKTVIGYGFEWKDIMAYTLGAIAIVLIENLLNKTK